MWFKTGPEKSSTIFIGANEKLSINRVENDESLVYMIRSYNGHISGTYISSMSSIQLMRFYQHSRQPGAWLKNKNVQIVVCGIHKIRSGRSVFICLCIKFRTKKTERVRNHFCLHHFPDGFAMNIFQGILWSFHFFVQCIEIISVYISDSYQRQFIFHWHCTLYIFSLSVASETGTSEYFPWSW